ncbi:MAG: orotidine-5'-phosphate decarboxylase [Candidatus Thioglobus sp.]|jgi:orotidine-5'-phosphate decarboxylase|nr:orotidine-5'-phosphate decarboxylase [Candidatus Pseudothioglobus aerophilus]MBT4909921.1 orotidine-5'-phosphate decarboxylase [Alphaproteobacteria bacterium]
MKDIKIEDRLIFALDVPEVSEAKKIVAELDDSVNFYKIGMELLMTGQYFELLDWLIARDKKVFVDLKFFDVPETVGRTIARLSDYGATFATIHGNQALMEKASENKNNLKILAVTALTSLDRGDLDDLGFHCNVKDLVISRAKRAFEAGCDGIVSSGLEVPYIREYVDNKLIAVTPGIRPVANDDDQKRVVDVATAFKSGSDYIVVGRPIKNAENRYEAAINIQKIIRSSFEAV